MKTTDWNQQQTRTQTEFIRIYELLPAIFGIAFTSYGLAPLLTPGTQPRTALTMICLIVGVIALAIDCKRFSHHTGLQVLTPGYWTERRISGRRKLGIGVIALSAGFALASAISTLISFYGDRIEHAALLKSGQIAQAQILARCGSNAFGCVTIDFTNPNRIQKSIPIDRTHYDLLEAGDMITIVYPIGRASEAVFTEFNFDRWRPEVPLAWTWIALVALSLGWFPLKGRLLGFVVRNRG